MYKPLLTQTSPVALMYLKECLRGSLMKEVMDPWVIPSFRICLFFQVRFPCGFSSLNGNPMIFPFLSTFKQYTNDVLLPTFEMPITTARSLLGEKYSDSMRGCNQKLW